MVCWWATGVAKVLIEQGGEFEHGYTYSGHPVACAVALANIRLIQDLKLVEHVHDDVGPYLASQFAQLKEHPLVGDAETCGLMGAIWLCKDKDTMTPFPADIGHRYEVPGSLLCKWFDNAGRRRPDDHCAAPGDHASADRRIDGPDPTLSRSHLGTGQILTRLQASPNAIPPPGQV